jgi:hypothetical protein
MAALTEVCILYSSNVWGEISHIVEFKKFGRLCMLDDGTSTRFRVQMGHEHVVYTLVHTVSQGRRNTIQIYFKPSRSHPIQEGRYFVKMFHDTERVFQGTGVYSNGITPVLHSFKHLG